MLARWGQFVDDANVHGLQDIAKSQSSFQKGLWAVVILFCTSIFVYQTYQMTVTYTSEKTVTEITKMNGAYPPPRFMIGVPTRVLLRSTRQMDDGQSPELDPEALEYAKYALNSHTQYEGDFKEKAIKAKGIFEKYLTEWNVTWARALEPYLIDIGPWLTDRRCQIHRPLGISKRVLWYPFTFHSLEPNETDSNQWTEGKRMWYDLCLDWSRSPLGQYKQLSLISYDVINDNFILKPGDKHKMTFQITAIVHMNLNRRPCDGHQHFHYRGYEEAACKEKCLLEAIMERQPERCLHMVDVRYSLLNMHLQSRPCWRDPGSAQNGANQSLPGLPEQADDDRVMASMKRCEKLNCFKACKQLTVRYQLTMGTVADDEPASRSTLVLQWPSPSGITVFEEKSLYTTESLVGQWGGLAGLWLGASMLSFFEIVYFGACCLLDIVRKISDKAKM